LTSSLITRFRPQPAARYVHPKALDRPADSGEHDHNLDVADEKAPNYLRWISDLVAGHLGYRVLELGAGIGSITELWARGHEVVASDLSDHCVSALRSRFADSPNITVTQTDVRAIQASGETFDSIVLVNVLEHIEDDAGILASLRPLLNPGGTVVIYVPALNGLYGPWDRKVGHYRRYSKWRLGAVAREAGLAVNELRYVNILAIPAWFAFSKSNIERTTSSGLSVWDRTGVPVGRALESRIRVPIGLNVLGVLSLP
jgi:SAM-dependent methyltransferase